MKLNRENLMIAAGLFEEFDKTDKPTINEITQEDRMKAEIDEFLADDMARAFDIADVEMPDELSGDRYEQAMDAAREALLAYFEENPSEMSVYFYGNLNESVEDIDGVLDVLKKKDGELKGPEDQKYMIKGEWYTWKYSQFDYVIFQVIRASKTKPIGVAAVQGHHLDHKVMEKYNLQKGNSWIAGVESYKPRYGETSPMDAQGLMEICDTITGGHSSYAQSFADYVAGGGE